MTGVTLGFDPSRTKHGQGGWARSDRFHSGFLFGGTLMDRDGAMFLSRARAKTTRGQMRHRYERRASDLRSISFELKRTNLTRASRTVEVQVCEVFDSSELKFNEAKT